MAIENGGSIYDYNGLSKGFEILENRCDPQLTGCTIQHVNNLEVQAWTVKYPGAKPHGGRTKSYTDAAPTTAT